MDSSVDKKHALAYFLGATFEHNRDKPLNALMVGWVMAEGMGFSRKEYTEFVESIRKESVNMASESIKRIEKEALKSGIDITKLGERVSGKIKDENNDEDTGEIF